MNWSLLLTKHPRSILQDDNAVIVLALLERSGLTTEEHLSTEVPLEKPSLKKTLLDLQLNGLVEYGSHHVRLTERGKFLIDRFKLQGLIVDDVLDALTLEGREREDYKSLLNVYRDSAFRFYQNSLCSIRIWRDLARRVPARDDPKEDAAETQAFMQTLLLRDLTNWWQHAHPPKGTLDKVNDELRSILTTNYSPGESEARDQEIIFDRFTLLPFRSSTLKARSTASPEEPRSTTLRLKLLFISFNYFQAASEPDKWFDNWCEAEPKLPKQSLAKNPEKYITELIEVLQTGLGTDPSEEVKSLPALLGDRWSFNRLKNDRTDELIDMLLLSSSLDELSNLTGLSQDSIRTLVTEISSKCSSLLQHDQDKRTPDVKDKSSSDTQRN